MAFDVNSQSTEEIGTAIDGRGGASAIYVPDRRAVYLFGGRAGFESDISYSILHYDVDRVTTDVLSVTLPVSRTETAAVYDSARKQAYIFGGWLPGDTPQYFADVLRFDPAAGTLSATSSALPSGRAGMSAVYVPGSDTVYLVGGVRATGCVDQILVYDPHEDQLTPLAAVLPTAAAHAVPVYDALGNEILLFGGWNPQVSGEHLDQIVVFDVEAETATLLPAKLPFIPSHPTLNFIVAAIILLLMCLAAGVLVRTQWGTNWARKLDTLVDSKVPMYGLLRNMAKRFTGENMLELSPAEISLHGGDTKVIGFVMERLGDGRATVYVPTSPLVSHGQVYIVPATSIAKLEASPRTVIDVLTSWGYGSRALCASDPEETAAPDKDGAG